VASGTVSQEIWRFDAPRSRARALRAVRPASPCAGAIWTIDDVPASDVYRDCPHQRLMRINARTPRQTVAATLRMPGDQCSSITAQAFADGAFYAIYTGQQPDLLYRITP